MLKSDPFSYKRNKKGCTYKGAAEQKARSTYEYLIDLTDDPAVLAPLRFLREREIVHFQRFGEANREDCSKIPKVLKAHKSGTFGRTLSIRKFAGHRHKPPYLLLHLKTNDET